MILANIAGIAFVKYSLILIHLCLLLQTLCRCIYMYLHNVYHQSNIDVCVLQNLFNIDFQCMKI